uniref:Uncharacterized protein n=1 Tax=Romanomermis culicivorax TaxID=13658 RepID=A0A915JU16_ROMCU
MYSINFASTIIVCIAFYNLMSSDAAVVAKVKSSAAKKSTVATKMVASLIITTMTTSTTTEDPFEVKSLEGSPKSTTKTATIALYICMSLVIMAIIGITFYIIMRRRAQTTAAGAISQDMTDLTGGNTRSREVNQIEETNRLKNLRKQKKSIEEIMMTQTLQKAKRPSSA